jgi:hypothetical protein
MIGDETEPVTVRWKMETSEASHRRAALSTMVSSTGWMSVGEREMMPRISPVAVCCASASVSSRSGLQLREEPHVLDGDHRLVGEGLSSATCLALKGRTSVR